MARGIAGADDAAAADVEFAVSHVDAGVALDGAAVDVENAVLRVIDAGCIAAVHHSAVIDVYYGAVP